jgi:hypothetical protein
VTPDSIESRFARLEQRVVDLIERVNELAPVALTVARLQLASEHFAQDLRGIQEDIDELRLNQIESKREHRVEDRTNRVAIIGLVGAVIAAVIGSISTLISARGGL